MPGFATLARDAAGNLIDAQTGQVLGEGLAITSANLGAVTVSPVGTAQGLAANNGASFGPDTSGTTTSGIQEALNSLTATTILDGAGNLIAGKSGWVALTSGVYRTTRVINLPFGVIRLEGVGVSTYIPAETGIHPYDNLGGTIVTGTDINGVLAVPYDSFGQPATSLTLRGIEFREVSPASPQSSSTAPVVKLDGVTQGEISNVNALEVQTAGGLGFNLYEMFRFLKGGNTDDVLVANIKGLGGSIGIRLSGPHITALSLIGGMVGNNVVGYASCFQLGFDVQSFYANLHAYNGKNAFLVSIGQAQDPNQPIIIHGCMLESVNHYLAADAGTTFGTILLENAGWSSGLDPTVDVPATMPATFTVMSSFERDDTGLFNPRKTLHLAPAASNLTAGASPFTLTLVPYNRILVITTVGGMTALTLDGQALFNGTFAVGQQVFVGAGHTLIATWATTAPVFRVLPQ